MISRVTDWRDEPPPPPRPEPSGVGRAGKVCGILGLILSLTGPLFLAFPMCILGIVLGGTGGSKTGMRTGIIGLILGVLTFFAYTEGIVQ
jgi:hypothetical protein